MVLTHVVSVAGSVHTGHSSSTTGRLHHRRGSDHDPESKTASPGSAHQVWDLSRPCSNCTGGIVTGAGPSRSVWIWHVMFCWIELNIGSETLIQFIYFCSDHFTMFFFPTNIYNRIQNSISMFMNKRMSRNRFFCELSLLPFYINERKEKTSN